MQAHVQVLSIALVVAGVYLALVRFVDLNEREPVWALALALVLGFGGAGAVELVARPGPGLDPWRDAVVAESVKLVALLIAVAIFGGLARVRGWSEITDLVDGIVYGIAVGLGYSVGETLIRQSHATSLLASTVFHTTGARALVNSALNGLSHGIFAGITGLGVGLAVQSRGPGKRVLFTLMGLAAAIAVNGSLFQLAHGNALGGQRGEIRTWLALLLPLLALIAVGLFGLWTERRAIRLELSPEVEAGVLTSAELALLESVWRRQLRYAGLLLSGRWRDSLHLAALHNRQVELALLKRRRARETDGAREKRLGGEVEALRAAIAKARRLVPAPPIALALALCALAGTAQRAQAQWETDSLLTFAIQDIGGYWSKQVDGYRPPVRVEAYGLTSACSAKRNNAEYCVSVRSIYYDGAFLDSLNRNVGDFAPVFVLAHEWGHLVQDLKGEMATTSGLFHIQLELQADCFAGSYAHDAATRKVLERGDEDEAVRELRQGHDPVDYPWFDEVAHGSSGQRIDAFDEGFNGRQCEGADFWRRVHVDPNAPQVQPTPPSGSLASQVACRRGRFDRVYVHAWPEVIRPGVTDAIQAFFRSPDGVEVYLSAVSFADTTAPDRFVDNWTQPLLDKGYKQINDGTTNDATGKQVGRFKVFSGTTEVVAYSNRQIGGLVEGPQGIAWEFMNSADIWQCSPARLRGVASREGP